LGYDAPRRTLAQRRRRQEARRTADDAEHRFADWSHVLLGLTRFLEETRSFRGLPSGSAGREAGALLRRGERAFLALAGAHLIEPRHSGGRFLGGTPGLWLRLGDGTRCEVGRSGGVFVPGLEQPTSVDVGDLLITDQRALLRGTLEHHEWLFGNLLAVHHDPGAPWTGLQLSNRETDSGFLYGHADVNHVRFRLMLALAVHTGTVARLRRELEAALAEHLVRQPPAP
jgi:hypothetical protein